MKKFLMTFGGGSSSSRGGGPGASRPGILGRLQRLVQRGGAAARAARDRIRGMQDAGVNRAVAGAERRARREGFRPGVRGR